MSRDIGFADNGPRRPRRTLFWSAPPAAIEICRAKTELSKLPLAAVLQTGSAGVQRATGGLSASEQGAAGLIR